VVEEEVYTQETVTLHSGDVLVFYTDGVTEALDRDDRQFGEERLQKVIREFHHLPAAGIVTKIQEEIQAFVAGTPQFDDITLMVIRVD